MMLKHVGDASGPAMQFLRVASFLDPRFKKLLFLKPEERETVSDLVKEQVRKGLQRKPGTHVAMQGNIVKKSVSEADRETLRPGNLVNSACRSNNRGFVNVFCHVFVCEVFVCYAFVCYTFGSLCLFVWAQAPGVMGLWSKAPGACIYFSF